MAARNLSPSLPFIVSTDRQKANPETRKLIRSHVMRGKNRIKPRKKSPKAPQEDQPDARSVVVVTGSPVWHREVPRKVCSELSTVGFAGSVEPDLIADVVSFSTMFSNAMFLLDDCISIETSSVTQTWFTTMLSDKAYLYAACFTVQAYFDGLLSRTRSLEAQRRDNLYYARVVKALQERLVPENDDKFLDSTIMTVLLLYGHAYTTGDFDSANLHSNGLLKLVSMRGVETFFQNTKLLIEIVRCDLCMAIDTNTKPVLFARNNIPWPLIVHHDYDGMLKNGIIDGCPIDLDPELKALWAASYAFCFLVNEAAAAAAVCKNVRAQISEQTYLYSTCAIMYRLLHLRFNIGTLDEAYRLGLLAFLSPLFLHWNRVELPDPRFTAAYLKALSELDMDEFKAVPARANLWLLVVGAVSMAHEPTSLSWLLPRLRVALEMCRTFTWDKLRNVLDSMLWVGMVYDRPGEAIFDLTVAGDRPYILNL